METNENKDKTPVLTIDEVRKTLGPQLQAIEDKARTEGRAEGATAERDRIKGIEAHATPGHEALLAEMKFDGKTTPAEAASRILTAENKKRGDKLTEIRKDAAPAVGANADPTAALVNGEEKKDTPESKMPPAQFAQIAAKRADEYTATMLAKGIKVSNADAVKHVYKEAGVPLS